MLLNIAGHTVSIQNVKVSKHERLSQNVQRHETTFCNAYVMCPLRFVTVYIM